MKNDSILVKSVLDNVLFTSKIYLPSKYLLKNESP